MHVQEKLQKNEPKKPKISQVTSKNNVVSKNIHKSDDIVREFFLGI